MRKRIVYLDSLDERLKEEVLQDRIEGTRDETVGGLTPARWGQVALMFTGDKGQDVLHCFARGLNTHATAMYLGISERTCRNTLAYYLDKLRALANKSVSVQTQMFWEDHLQDDEFAPDRRPPTRRGRPRKVAETEALQMDMCY